MKASFNGAPSSWSRRPFRGEHDDPHSRHPIGGRLDQGSDVTPRQAAVAAAECGDRNRSDPVLRNHLDESVEADAYVVQPGRAAPMLLGRKVDHVPVLAQNAPVEREHVSQLHLVATAGGPVGAVVVGERTLELEGDSLAHHADGVHGVDERLHVGGQQIAVAFHDHSVHLLPYP
jgi:hypothetical protein